MNYKSLLIVFSATILFLFGFSQNAKSQDAHLDSVISKAKTTSKIFKNIHSSYLQSDDTDSENTSSEDNSEYGIGNVLGKSKKSGKVYKKSGKSIKVQIQITAEKILVYEIRFDKANFGISKSFLDV